MAENSKIEWTHHTFNPWVGCKHVSPACDHCYAQAWAIRTGQPDLWEGNRRRTTEANWRKMLRLHAAVPEGQRQRVFSASLADVFDNEVPVAWRVDLFRLIAQTPRFDWLLLTKRIGNAWPMMLEVSSRCAGGEKPMSNVWLGATVVNQEEFDRDVPKLLRTPAAVRFLSVEPMLGPIEFGGMGGLDGLHWVICGGESGGRARPLELPWAVRLRESCAARGIAFFMKQGSKANWPDFKNFDTFLPDLRVRQWPCLPPVAA